jgi:hypothetical protein
MSCVHNIDLQLVEDFAKAGVDPAVADVGRVHALAKVKGRFLSTRVNIGIR